MSKRQQTPRIPLPRGWSLEHTARLFHLTAATIASWMKRVDEQGPDALVQIREPVNKFRELCAPYPGSTTLGGPSA